MKNWFKFTKTTRLVKQIIATTALGELIKEGDDVYFINSDKQKVVGKIKRRENGTLFFHNIDFEIKDYQNLKKEVN